MGNTSSKLVRINPIFVDEERDPKNGLLWLNRDILMKLVKIIKRGKNIRIVVGMTGEFYQWSKLRIFRQMRYGAFVGFTQGQTKKEALAGRKKASICAIGGAIPQQMHIRDLPLEYVDLRQTGWKKIESQCFKRLENLVWVDLPLELEEIGYYAFDECYSLREIWFPEGLKVVKEWGFCRCNQLKAVYFPPGFETLEWCAFACCTSLQRVELPSAMKAIDKEAFEECTSLETLVVGDVEKWGGKDYRYESLGTNVKLKELRLTGSRWETLPTDLANCLSANARVIGQNFVGRKLGKFVVVGR